ncbi:hypothetical protein Q7P37_009636 [Cladosporium fusiforme]
MPRNILITGGTGYIGGSLLAELKKSSSLPTYGTIYALVRNNEQAEKVRAVYNATPLILDLESQDAITESLLEKQISVVVFLINAFNADAQLKFIQGLATVKEQLGLETHFLHTTGAKLFSGFVGHPTDRVLSDAENELFDIQKSAKSKFPPMETAVGANSKIIEAGEQSGVKTYIYIPCIVYGEGKGFGNRISIQTVAIVRAAKALRRVCKVDNENGSWPVCHIDDTVALYVQLLHKILAEENIGCNRDGYYLASSGSVAWADLYKAMAKAMAQHGAVDDDTLHEASEDSLEAAAKALGSPKEFVPVEMGGS